MVQAITAYQDRTTLNMAAGVAMGVIGSTAYFLPVKKDRFVRTACDVHKEIIEDKIEMLNDSAKQIMKNKLKDENKLFLSQEGVAEDVNIIVQKCKELKKSITDDDRIKALKQTLEDSFDSFKKSEAKMDNIASEAFRRIRWTNFGWGVGICFLLGASIGAACSSKNTPKYF